MPCRGSMSCDDGACAGRVGAIRPQQTPARNPERAAPISRRRRWIESDIAQALINSKTAAANASGAYRRVMSARGTTMDAAGGEFHRAVDWPSVAGLTPSPSPSSVTAGTAIGGSAAKRR